MHSCKVTHLQNSLMCTKVIDFICFSDIQNLCGMSQIFCSISVISRLYVPRLIYMGQKPADKLWHEDVKQSKDKAGCSTVKSWIQLQTERKGDVKMCDMNSSERVLMWGRQNGSWFSQRTLQHEWISIINCSVWAGTCVTSNSVKAHQLPK